MKKENIKNIDIKQIKGWAQGFLKSFFSLFKKYVDIILIVFLLFIVFVWGLLSFNYVYKVIILEPNVSISVLSINEKALNKVIDDIKNRESERSEISSDGIKNPFKNNIENDNSDTGGNFTPDLDQISPTF